MGADSSKCCYGSSASDATSEGLNVAAENGHADAHESDNFKLVINKSADSNKLGIDIDLGNDVSVLVEKIEAGLILEWNAAHPAQQVQEGDLIISVNGHANDAQAITDRLVKDDVLAITIKRGLR